MSTTIAPHILESLRNPSAYPVATGTVELIQTHVSWLFLTDTYVYKLKKPVNFGFLDFSTRELRHFYCHEELRLNRRLCPDIYERVIALHQTTQGASFAGEGPIIDYAVMMKRLPANRMLERLVDSNTIFEEDIKIVARTISEFHSEAATSSYISEYGSLQQVLFNWQENFEQTRPFLASTLPPGVSSTIRSYVDSFAATHLSLFSERIERGYIRECDGDIHLGNICLMDNKAYIFDCIEFNERFRFSDTAADIAFLLMDLDFHGRPDLAEAALSEYIKDSGDAGCVALIPFYKVYRAFVRGKVESLQLSDAGIDLTVRDMIQKRAVRYFRLAQGYCLRENLPLTLFITCGTMGCGKSTLAAQLAFELGLPLYNSDIIRKKAAGLQPETAVQVSFGEGLYSTEMNRRTYRGLEQLAEMELTNGHSVILDAAFGNSAERAVIAKLAASHNAACVILSIRCNREEQRLRLLRRLSKGNHVSDGRIELLDQQEQTFQPPVEPENSIELVSTRGSSDQMVDTLYSRLFPS
ncbi:MAG: AAA family ATPase [Desulfuromonadaceae bacterium]|nr:AAA family ATPase [Desulfuromonadaceae bacterium]